MSRTIYIGAKDRRVIGGDGRTRNSVKRDSISLTKEQVKELFSDREKNRSKIIRAMNSYAYRVSRQSSICSNNIDDFFQAALIGINKAIDRYDPLKGVAFHTYCNFYITNEFAILKQDLGIGYRNSTYTKVEAFLNGRHAQTTLTEEELRELFHENNPDHKYKPSISLLKYLRSPTKIYTCLNNMIEGREVERHELIGNEDVAYDKIDVTTFWLELESILKDKCGKKWKKYYFAFAKILRHDNYMGVEADLSDERLRQLYHDTVNIIKGYPYIKTISSIGEPKIVDFNNDEEELIPEYDREMPKVCTGKLSELFSSTKEYRLCIAKIHSTSRSKKKRQLLPIYNSLKSISDKYNWLKVNKEYILSGQYDKCTDVAIHSMHVSTRMLTDEWNYIKTTTTPLLPNEILKKIKGFKGYYVSNYGRIFKAKKNTYHLMYVNYCKKTKRHRVQIRKDNKTYTLQLHRTVALHFIDNPFNYPDVLFANGNNEDCRIENLFWGNQPGHIAPWNPKTKQKGETCIFNEKLTEQKVIEIYMDPRSHSAIAKDNNISRPFVTMIKSGKRWGWLTKDLTLKKQAI